MHSNSGNDLIFNTGGASEQMRIDTSGRLLVGTSTARTDFLNTSTFGSTVQIETATTSSRGLAITNNASGNSEALLFFNKANSSNTGSSTVVSDGNRLGSIYFQGADGSELVAAAQISAEIDGTPGANDMPGRLVFSTTADGASSPTERLRITSTGAFAIEGASNYGSSGQVLTSNGNDAPTWQSAAAANVGGATAISMNDNVKINFGASNDLQIYHDGSNSYVKDTGTGSLKIQGTNLHIESATGEAFVMCTADGAVELYHNNSLRFQTNATATTMRGGGEHRCEGHFRPWANNTYDLGTNGDRWRNVYTHDLHLSNEGSTNDVDGTWGNYTIQEGEDDLFLINRRSGKKYKFNLTEVS